MHKLYCRSKVGMVCISLGSWLIYTSRRGGPSGTELESSGVQCRLEKCLGRHRRGQDRKEIGNIRKWRDSEVKQLTVVSQSRANWRNQRRLEIRCRESTKKSGIPRNRRKSMDKFNFQRIFGLWLSTRSFREDGINVKKSECVCVRKGDGEQKWTKCTQCFLAFLPTFPPRSYDLFP